MAAGIAFDWNKETIMADPDQPEPRIHETTTEARAGSTPGVARNVLIFGTLSVVILFIVIVLVGRV